MKALEFKVINFGITILKTDSRAKAEAKAKEVKAEVVTTINPLKFYLHWKERYSSVDGIARDYNIEKGKADSVIFKGRNLHTIANLGNEQELKNLKAY